MVPPAGSPSSAPLGRAVQGPAAQTSSPSAAAPAEEWRPVIDPELQRSLELKIFQARLQVATGHIPVGRLAQPPETEPEPPIPMATRSTTGMLQDAHTNAPSADMTGPTSAAELFPGYDGYLFSRPSIWR